MKAREFGMADLTRKNGQFSRSNAYPKRSNNNTKTSLDTSFCLRLRVDILPGSNGSAGVVWRRILDARCQDSD